MCKKLSCLNDGLVEGQILQKFARLETAKYFFCTSRKLSAPFLSLKVRLQRLAKTFRGIIKVSYIAKEGGEEDEWGGGRRKTFFAAFGKLLCAQGGAQLYIPTQALETE